ncbi:hypothetical protein NDU88_003458 [Pleurodeles waltl]|uniref:Uncharacterized protein n=1 Tax=Pleurodeles waltl TaxID=8319 RepID=A0AAV7LIM1_PLEWA|nr:hypothetical protein NDU88_003458 [Pleurodeles waltl]
MKRSVGQSTQTAALSLSHQAPGSRPADASPASPSSEAVHLLPQPGLSPPQSGLVPSACLPHGGRSPQPSRQAASASLLEAQTNTGHLLCLFSSARPKTPGPPECGPVPPRRQLTVSASAREAQRCLYALLGGAAGAVVRPDRRQPQLPEGGIPPGKSTRPRPQGAAGSAAQQGAPAPEARAPSQAAPRGRAFPPIGKTLRPALKRGPPQDLTRRQRSQGPTHQLPR